MNFPPHELIVDSFAGGGGASLGIEQALGRPADIAINHDADALVMHAANHPSTLHVLEDVWRARLGDLVSGRPVGLLWASPDCRHFSRAKGGKPVSKSVRSLAWVVIRWAEQVRPRIIILENVREFADWGPLVPRWECACGWWGTEGQAVLVRTRRKCPRCDSRSLLETSSLMPCPDRKGLTFKKWAGRLRNLGYRVEYKTLDAADFGAPTHRRRLFLIARRDDRPIEWPEPSHGDPRKLDDQPLFGRLLAWRTAAECIDWAVPCPSIFERARPLAEATMRRIAHGVKRYVIDSAEPFLVRCAHGESGRWGNGAQSLNSPLPTITASKDYAIVCPVITSLAHGEASGTWGNSRSHDARQPLGTIHAGGGNHALVAAFLAKHFGGMVGVPIDTPLPTTTTIGTQNQLVSANLVRFNFDDAGVSIDRPLPTVTRFNHAALVYTFLVKYFGTSIGQAIDTPLHTVTGHDRFGLVTVTINGEPFVVVDIGMRMLSPRELARAQGFPENYQLTGTKTSQVARVGNSVCPAVAAAVIAANCVSVPEAVTR